MRLGIVCLPFIPCAAGARRGANAAILWRPGGKNVATSCAKMPQGGILAAVAASVKLWF